MLAANVEKLMDHSMNITDSYWRPTEEQLLLDYLQAVDYLTIDNNNRVEDKLVNQLQNDIMLKLVEKENEIDSMKKQFEELKKTQDQMVKNATSMQRLEDWLDQYNDDKLPVNIETMIWEYLDPYEDGTVSKQERLKRQREFPELVRAARRLQALRLNEKKEVKKKKNHSHT
jgi:hypothetical protein